MYMLILAVFLTQIVYLCSLNHRIVEVKAFSHQGYPLTYELTTDTGQSSNEFAIDPTSGVVDLLRKLDYEKDLHQYHLKVKVIENGRPARSNVVNVSRIKLKINCFSQMCNIYPNLDKSLCNERANMISKNILKCTNLRVES